MKKATSIILSIIISVLALSPCYTYIAEEIDKKNVLAIGNDISQMCAEYDDYESLAQDDDKTIYTRLIVKANDIINEYGAVDSVYGFGYAFLQYADKKTAEEAKAQYENLGYTVDYASVITPCSTNISFSLPQYENWGDEWAYEETDALATVDYYKLKVKSNIEIAIVDSGINYNHELFKNRVVRTNVDFSAEATGDEMDKYSHGTMVAGAIVNSTPSNVKLSVYKVFDKNGDATSSEFLSALEYIKQSSNKPDIINCSFVSRSGLGTVIDELVDMGITVVAGAGNDSVEVYQQPAIFDSTITVAATDYYGKPCSFSNYGEQVDISAPGKYVYTADMSSTTAYTFANGTSLAAPIVSAAAAIVLMEHNNYTPEQVKQELIETSIPFKKGDFYNIYGAGIVNFSNIISGTRCKDVTANYESGVYHDDINVELKCANTLVDIYYTTDGTLPAETNGTKYSEPIQISESTKIIVSAYARAGTPFRGKFTTLDYYILEDGESEFVIDDSGTIKAYLRNETNLVVPGTVNGVTPLSIGEKCFRDSNIESIVLPETVNNLLSHSFYGCDKLSNINLANIKHIGKKALSGCSSLTQDVKLSSAEYIDERGLADTYFNSIKLPSCTQIGDSAFMSCMAEDVILNSATTIGNYAFQNCINLKNLYVTKLTGFGDNSLLGCTSLEFNFAPKLTGISFAIPNDITLYCSDKLKGVSFPSDYSDYTYTIVSPEYTPGLAGIDTTQYNRVNSDDKGTSKGGQIRTRDNGLRFGFEFDKSNIGFDFSKYAEDIEYGFVYTYDSYENKNDFQKNLALRADKNNVKVKTADKRNAFGTISTYNAVFTDIPEKYFDYEISVRAYVCIDGMYFYSPVETSSINDALKYNDDDANDNDIQFEHVHSFTKSLVAPSCESGGYTLYICKNCKESYMDNFADALGHNYDFTGYTDGTYNYICTVCDKADSKRKSDLPEFIQYVNTNVTRGNNNMYLDLNNDDFINAKNFAKIHHLSKYGW